MTAATNKTCVLHEYLFAIYFQQLDKILTPQFHDRGKKHIDYWYYRFMDVKQLISDDLKILYQQLPSNQVQIIITLSILISWSSLRAVNIGKLWKLFGERQNNVGKVTFCHTCWSFTFLYVTSWLNNVMMCLWSCSVVGFGRHIHVTTICLHRSVPLQIETQSL